jgi:hypothetical protein
VKSLLFFTTLPTIKERKVCLQEEAKNSAVLQITD